MSGNPSQQVQIYGLHDVTGKRYPFRANPNGSMDVVINDQTTPPLFPRFIIESGTWSLREDTVIGNRWIEVDISGGDHGFYSGCIVEIYNDDIFLQAHVLGFSGVASGSVELDQPVDRIYGSGSTSCYWGSHLLNVSGSADNPVIARIRNGDLNVEWDITQIDIYLQDGADMDNAQFGGLGFALKYGVVFRGNSNDIYNNAFNMKTNADIVLVCNNWAYNDRAPSGSYSLSGKKLLGGQDNLGVVSRLRVGDGVDQKLEIVIQDDLRGLEEFWINAEGSEVLP